MRTASLSLHRTAYKVIIGETAEDAGWKSGFGGDVDGCGGWGVAYRCRTHGVRGAAAGGGGVEGVGGVLTFEL